MGHFGPGGELWQDSVTQLYGGFWERWLLDYWCRPAFGVCITSYLWRTGALHRRHREPEAQDDLDNVYHWPTNADITAEEKNKAA